LIAYEAGISFASDSAFSGHFGVHNRFGGWKKHIEICGVIDRLREGSATWARD
jgi:hypothetical protein